MATILTPTILGIVGLVVASIFLPQYRRVILPFACVIGVMFVDRFGLPFRIQPYHLIPFFIFNAIFVFVVDRTENLRRHYLAVFLTMVSLLLLIQYMAGVFAEDWKSAVMFSTPIIYSFWSYMNYVKVPMPEITYVERVLWLKPFWYGWVLPYGSNVDIKKTLLSNPPINVTKFRRYSLIAGALVVSVFFYENAFFIKPYLFPKVTWIPQLLDLPLISIQGYEFAFNRYPIGPNLSELEQSLLFLLIQSMAVIHFLLYIATYSTSLITLAVLAGFDLPLHVQELWKAKNLSDFYLKMNFHYSTLIRNHMMPIFIRLPLPFLKGRLRQAWIVGISVFLTSAISLQFGRSLWLGHHVDFFERLSKAGGNFHYPAIAALICALKLLYRKSAKHEETTSSYWQPLRIALYFFIFQFALIFGFQFLRTDAAIKIEYAKTILKIFIPTTYL